MMNKNIFKRCVFFTHDVFFLLFLRATAKMAMDVFMLLKHRYLYDFEIIKS